MVVKIAWDGRDYSEEDLSVDFGVARKFLGPGPYWASTHDTGLLLSNEEVPGNPTLVTRQGSVTAAQFPATEERWVRHEDLEVVRVHCSTERYDLVF